MQEGGLKHNFISEGIFDSVDVVDILDHQDVISYGGCALNRVFYEIRGGFIANVGFLVGTYATVEVCVGLIVVKAVMLLKIDVEPT